MTIKTKPATDAYRAGYDAVFPAECPHCDLGDTACVCTCTNECSCTARDPQDVEQPEDGRGLLDGPGCVEEATE